MSNADRLAIFERQAHAFGHVAEGDLSHPVTLCPLCLHGFGDGDIHSGDGHTATISIEHAPPHQPTRFGGSRAACLTHVECNNQMGYEGRAGRYRSEVARLRNGQPGKLRVQLGSIETWVTFVPDTKGLRPLVELPASADLELSALLPLDAQLTELKAAYLIAFTVLGFSWACGPALDPVRAAIRTGEIAGLSGIHLFRSHEPNPELAETVVVAPSGVAVIGPDPTYGLLLPNTSPIAATSDSLSLHDGVAHPWLADKWWRHKNPVAFRMDCMATTPMWRIEIEELV